MNAVEVSIKLPRPHKHQQAVLSSKKRWRIVSAGRRFGKSQLASIEVIKRMLDGELTAYVTPVFSLGKMFYGELLNLIPKVLIQSENKTDLEIKLITGGSIKFFSGENLDAFRGRKFHFIVMDEAAYLNNLEDAWLNSIRPTLTDFSGSALFISTPRGKNYFYSLFTKGLTGEADFESFHFTSYDNPFLNTSEIDEAKTLLTVAAFNQEYLAIPGENVNNPFGVDYIQGNTLNILSTEPTVVYGIDVARTTDWTVIIGLDLQGHQTYFERFQMPWTATMERIKNLNSQVPKLMDATGAGSVLFEQLQQVCHNIQGFTFTAQSKPKLIMELIKAIENGELKFNDITANELSVFEYKITSNNHIKYEAQSGFHDDCVIALALANHHKGQAIASANWKLYSA